VGHIGIKAAVYTIKGSQAHSSIAKWFWQTPDERCLARFRQKGSTQSRTNGSGDAVVFPVRRIAERTRIVRRACCHEYLGRTELAFEELEKGNVL